MDQADGFLHSQPGLLRTLSFSLVALLIVFTVLKPLSRQIVTSLSQAPALPASHEGASPMPHMLQPGFAHGALPSAAHPTETQALYRQIAEQVRKEPAQSARVIESWINARAEDTN